MLNSYNPFKTILSHILIQIRIGPQYVLLVNGDKIGTVLQMRQKTKATTGRAQ